MTEKFADQEFLEMVVRALAEHPENIKINRTVDDMGVLLTLDVHPEDMGKIIGRMGNTAKAIRTLLRIVGMKHNARVNLKINEPEGAMRSQGAPADFGAPIPQTQTMKSVEDSLADLKL